MPTPDIDRITTRQRDFRKLDPHKMILWMALFGITSLFVGLMSAFIMSHAGNWHELRMPKAFLVSTVAIALSSIAFEQVKRGFRTEQRLLFRYSFLATGILGILFMISQTFGWYALQLSDVNLKTSIGGSYLYLISGLHAMHVLGGMIFMGLALWQALKQTDHDATALFYFTDGHKKRQLDLLGIYWHFMDGIWLALIVVFLWQFL